MKILSFILFTLAALSVFFLGTIRKPFSTLVLEGNGHSIKKIPATGSEAIHHNSFNDSDFSKNRNTDFVQPQEERSLNSRITVLETEFEISHAIDRLNNGSVTDDERLQIVDQFKELDRLRTSALEIELAEVERKVAQLESQLPEKLKALGVYP